MKIIALLEVTSRIQTGRGRGRDLTQMETIDRRVRLPLSKWSPTGVLREGHGVDFFSGLIGVLGFQVNVWFEEDIASLPGGYHTRA